MYTKIHHHRQFDRMFPVQASEEIEYLVKESEVITGQPGRTFVISSADRLVYRIQWHPIGYQVQRLNAAGNTICTLNMVPDEFRAHSLGEAMRVGQLFAFSCETSKQRNMG
jgi:hypothetical protein